MLVSDGPSGEVSQGRMQVLDIAPRSRVNGIDLDALDDLVDRVRNDPKEGFTGFRVMTEWKGQTRSETTVESFTCGGEPIRCNFTMVCDEPRALLGQDSAPNPQEMLLTAFNACLMVGYVAQSALRGIKLDDCRIETSGDMDMRGFLGLDETVCPGYRRISYTVYISGNGSREQFEEIHQAVMATSPNYFNLAQPVQMCGRLA